MKNIIIPFAASIPTYRHDCRHCHFLGCISTADRYVDLYFCNQGQTIPTVIARYSSQGRDYSSGLVDENGAWTVSNTELYIAAILAQRAGLIE